MLSGLAVLPGRAMAQTTINRCIGANGGIVFSDQPCAALPASKAGDGTPATADSAPGGSAAPMLCAADVVQLRRRISAAFARHDANRLAGLMLWDGDNEGSAIADMRSLDELVKGSLLDIRAPGAPATGRDPAPAQSLGGIALDPFGTGAGTVPATGGNQLVLQTTGAGGPRERPFDLVRRAGCLWLRSAD
jgi:hypothetical protein